jgi:Na+/melibiose symporter-like transporter
VFFLCALCVKSCDSSSVFSSRKDRQEPPCSQRVLLSPKSLRELCVFFLCALCVKTFDSSSLFFFTQRPPRTAMLAKSSTLTKISPRTLRVFSLRTLRENLSKIFSREVFYPSIPCKEQRRLYMPFAAINSSCVPLSLISPLDKTMISSALRIVLKR